MKSVLSALRELPTMIRVPTAEGLMRDGHPFSLVPGGFPKTGLVEVTGQMGSGKTGVILRFLGEHPGLRVAWVEENLTIYPCALPQHEVGLERVLFVDAKEGSTEALWTAHQILRSQIFGVLVLVAHDYDLTALRRLQLAAEKAKALVILLSEQVSRGNVWPISVQLEVDRGGVRILKHKFAGMGMPLATTGVGDKPPPVVLQFAGGRCDEKRHVM